jgi:hypothetical protein
MAAAINPQSESMAKQLGSMSLLEVQQFMAAVQSELDARYKALEPEVSKIFDGMIIQYMSAQALAKLPVVTQEELGISKGCDWSEGSVPVIDPKKMPAPAVRGVSTKGIPFIVVRYFREDNPSVQKTECVYRRAFHPAEGWVTYYGQNLFSVGGMGGEDFSCLSKLLKGDQGLALHSSPKGFVKMV